MVGESGLFTPDDIVYVQDAGVKAVSLVNFFFKNWVLCKSDLVLV